MLQYRETDYWEMLSAIMDKIFDTDFGFHVK